MLSTNVNANNREHDEAEGSSATPPISQGPANLQLLAQDLDDSDLDDEEPDVSSAVSADPGRFPEHLLEVGGLMGEMMAYTAATAHRCQPVLALGGAVAAMATLCGRRVTDMFGTRTNSYCLAIAPTASGKEQPRKTNDKCFSAAGLGGLRSGLMGPESLNSHAGILTQLAKRPVLLCQIDEMGRFLASVNAKGAANYQRMTIDMLLKLYSRSDGIYRGDALKKENETRPIIQPHLSIYASTVPDNFFAAMTRETLTGGLLGRFLVFPGDSDPEHLQPLDQSPPQSLVDKIEGWGRFHAHSTKPIRDVDEESNADSILRTQLEPYRVPYDEGAHQIFEQLQEEVRERTFGIDEITRALYGRSVEKARKFALIKACSDGIPSPSCLRVTPEAARWACELVKYQTAWILYHARERLAETQFEADGNELRRFISEMNGRVTKTQICNRFRKWPPDYREKVLTAQYEAARIRIETEETGGRTKTHYVLR